MLQWNVKNTNQNQKIVNNSWSHPSSGSELDDWVGGVDPFFFFTPWPVSQVYENILRLSFLLFGIQKKRKRERDLLTPSLAPNTRLLRLTHAYLPLFLNVILFTQKKDGD